MLSTDREAIAWAAGLFEGEGYLGIGVYKAPDPRGPRSDLRRGGLKTRSLVMGMTDEDVVRRFHDVVGCGRVRFRPRGKPHWKDSWRWECSRWTDMEPVLLAFLPYFGERRGAKAKAMLADPPRPISGYRVTHCKWGHEFTPENTYHHKRRRHCRICMRARWKVNDAKRRAKRRAAKAQT